MVRFSFAFPPLFNRHQTLTNTLLKEAYLRTRPDTKFDSSDFDSLSNKFLSKLVIRAN